MKYFARRWPQVLRLAREGHEPSRVDLSTLGMVLEGLRELTGEAVTFDDLLEYAPAKHDAELDHESRAWLESDLSRLAEFEPYAWEEGEAEEGKSVTCEVDQALVKSSA